MQLKYSNDRQSNQESDLLPYPGYLVYICIIIGLINEKAFVWYLKLATLSVLIHTYFHAVSSAS